MDQGLGSKSRRKGSVSAEANKMVALSFKHIFQNLPVQYTE